MSIRKSYFGLVLLMSSACGSQPDTSHAVPLARPAKPTVRLREVYRDDFIIPSHLASAATWRGSDAELPYDTVTSRGNFVRYLLTDDSCCADNVYLRWGNARFSRTYIIPRVRQYRSYFTPMLAHETKDYLILEHGCATDCGAVLFLPLNKTEQPQDIEAVVGYDPQSYTVVHGFANFKRETAFEFLQATNVRTRKTRRIVFRHPAMAALLRNVVDSCRVDKRSIYLKATLRLAEEREEQVTEEVRLPNDIQ